MTTYICRACSIKHDIPRREDCPEVGICPVCQDVHALYLVKREPAPDVSPWVLVGERLPEMGELVLIARSWHEDPGVGWICSDGEWFVKFGVRAPDPVAWCPIPPLPEEA